MIELSHHIEKLLLKNDCVIVPEFGAFVTQRIPARIIEKEGLFFPPYKSVGFNSQLQMNDGTLIHSYMESARITYSQAEEHVKHAVDIMRRRLLEENIYDLGSIGTFERYGDGSLEFTPYESGVL